MIDILLINPKENSGFFEKMPPMGLAYIAANLEKHNFSVKIIDFELEKKDLSYWLSKSEPQFLGISGTTHTRFESFRLAKEAKAFNREIITIYGGVHATFTAFETLRHIKDIDFVVQGEGEDTLLELIDTLKKAKDIKRVRGVTYRSDNGIQENPPAPRIHPLDHLPSPAYDLLDMHKYALNMEFVNKKGISLITSRGCLAKCSFCSASRMFDHQVTMHSGKRVLDEIEYLFKNYAFEGLKIFDSTLTIKRDHINSICDEILNRDLKFPWECEIRVGTVDQMLLEKMKEAGCYYVNFGIESASQRVLNLMRKGFTIEQAEALLLLCHKVGLKTKVFFSFGHIGETMDDVDTTFRFIDKNQHYITTVASGAGVRIYPGTYLENYASNNGLLPKDFGWSLPYDEPKLGAIFQTRCVPILLQPQLGYEELERTALRIYSRRFRGWKGFKLGIKKITNKDKLVKLGRLAKLRVKNALKAKG